MIYKLDKNIDLIKTRVPKGALVFIIKESTSILQNNIYFLIIYIDRRGIS